MGDKISSRPSHMIARIFNITMTTSSFAIIKEFRESLVILVVNIRLEDEWTC
jgi:hypothetical protein